MPVRVRRREPGSADVSGSGRVEGELDGVPGRDVEVDGDDVGSDGAGLVDGVSGATGVNTAVRVTGTSSAALRTAASISGVAITTCTVSSGFTPPASPVRNWPCGRAATTASSASTRRFSVGASDDCTHSPPGHTARSFWNAASASPWTNTL